MTWTEPDVDSVLIDFSLFASVRQQVTEGRKVSFAYFMAFISLLNNIELIKRVYLNATGGSRLEPITKDELLLSAQRMSQITPLEIDILYQLTGQLHQPGYVANSSNKWWSEIRSAAKSRAKQSLMGKSAVNRVKFSVQCNFTSYNRLHIVIYLLLAWSKLVSVQKFES